MKVKSGTALCQCVNSVDICHGIYPGEVCVCLCVTVCNIIVQDDITATSYQYSYVINISPDLIQVELPL